MIYGAIEHKSVKGHTCLASLFKAIDNQQLHYNWLITDYEGCAEDEQICDKLEQEYCWLTGEELTEIIEKEDFQWIWGILLGFRKEIALSKILESPLPDIEKATFWKNPVSIQHELADIEIIAFDSTYTVFKSKSKELYEGFRRYYTKSEDLEEHNKE